MERKGGFDVDAAYVTFYEFGSPGQVLKVENRELQRPKAGEVLVQMTERPINPSDLLPVYGVYSHRISLPAIPGYEGVGVVVDVGPSVSSQWIGKRILPLRGEGTWQEYVTCNAELAVPVPDFMEDYMAAQLYINPITAWVACTEVLALKPGDVLLVNACGSSIGRIFAQLSQVLGFQLIAITRNHHYTEELLQLGATHVINTAETPLQPTVMEWTNGRGAKAAIDSIGGTDGSDLAFLVQSGGIVLTIGLLSGQPVHWADISKRTNVQVKMLHLRHWNQQVSVQEWQNTFQHLISLIQKKKLTFRRPDAHYSLSQVHEAVRYAESSRRNKGKVFLTS